MELNNYSLTKIYIKKEIDNQINLVFYNDHKSSEALVFLQFSFYLINISSDMNLGGFVELLLPKEYEDADESILYIEGISSTDTNDIVYIKLSNGYIIILQFTFDKFSGDSFQDLRILTPADTHKLTPLNISEYEKFKDDFESEKYCDVLDLRFL